MSDLFFSRVDIVIRIRKNRRNLCYPSLMGNIKMLERSRLSYLSFLFLISFSLSESRRKSFRGFKTRFETNGEKDFLGGGKEILSPQNRFLDKLFII